MSSLRLFSLSRSLSSISRNGLRLIKARKKRRRDRGRRDRGAREYKDLSMNEAFDLFEEQVASQEKSESRIQETLSHLMYKCQGTDDVVSNSEGVLKMIEKHSLSPDRRLSTSIMDYLVMTKDSERVWATYERLFKSRNITARLQQAFTLLQFLLDDCREVSRVTEILNMIKECNYEIEDETHEATVQSFFELAVAETKEGREIDQWRDAAYIAMGILGNAESPLSEPTAAVITKWLTSQWGGKESISITNTTISSKQTCNNCHHKVEANKLTEAEHSFLLNHARTKLEKEADSFEDSHREVQECKNFLAICEKFGPFGVIIDGLNVLGYIKNHHKLLALCHWGLSRSPLPVLVIGRRHMQKELSLIPKPHNVYAFLTRDGVAEDHYYIYGALHSGRNTLFLSNDTLRDHIHHYGKETAGLYRKWIRSCQVTHKRDTVKDHAKNLKMPKPYAVKLQWTDDNCHIPRMNEEWTCLQRIK